MDAKKETEKIVKKIREYYKKNNLGGAIIGISGGKDSAVAAALLTKALGSENVIGLTLPCHTKDECGTDAKLISDYYGFPLINFDLTNVFDSFKEELKNVGDFSLEETKNSDINIKPRLRMSTLYYFAALYSSLKKKTYLVMGTSNKCELFVGYFTKGGDSVCDMYLLSHLKVSEVIKVGEYLQVPEKVLYKTPSDDISDLSDEDKLGVKYRDIEAFMDNPNTLPKEIRDKVEKLHNGSRHKFNIPNCGDDE